MRRKGQYEIPFSVKILDSNFNLVTPIYYDNLQWDRQYNKVGKFVIDGVVGDYDRDTWKYVYTAERKELGVISQVNLKKTGGRRTLTISGLFVEQELNKMIVYAKPSKFDDDAGTHYGTSILSTNAPTWITQEGDADDVALAFFNGFKQISFRNYRIGDFSGTTLVTDSFELDIDYGTTATGTYNNAIHTRNNERLGDKIYDILKESGASYEVVFDYLNRTKTFNIIHGVDRTQSGHAFGVNPICFSMSNGSIKQVSMVTSNTDTKDVMLQYAEDETKTLILVNALDGSVGRFVAQSMSSSQSDFINEETVDFPTADKNHKLAVMSDASLKLHELEDTINIQFDFVNSSYRYMDDFDLGDKVSVDIPELGVSIDTQIIACHEVIKKGVWDMTIEVGKAIIRKRGRV